MLATNDYKRATPTGSIEKARDYTPNLLPLGNAVVRATDCPNNLLVKVNQVIRIVFE